MGGGPRRLAQLVGQRPEYSELLGRAGANVEQATPGSRCRSTRATLRGIAVKRG